MFPYPSGSLHMGHMRVYTLSDAIARFHRLNGKNVIHPMGWDAFGLPAENAAFERKENPEEWTQKNIANMKSLLEEMYFSFDWDKEFATCDSDYYKWTQFLFLKLYEKGLAYRKEALVNWDPVDETVLANEQVSETGRSWRSGALVEKRLLKQWFIRTTNFTKSLYDGLQELAENDWKEIKSIQEHWLGNPDGTTISFNLVNSDTEGKPKQMSVWMKCPEYIDQIKFVAIKPDSFWSFGSVKEGLLPYSVENPFTGEILPVYVTCAVEFPEDCDVHVGIPELNILDRDFADSVNIKYTVGLQSVASKEELLSLREKICAEARERGIGGYPASSKLKDWLISRQRFWGTPIPIVYCQKCGEQPLSEKDLPVRLPKVKLVQRGENPLSTEKDWLNTVCPKCGGEAVRETDTMDTFVDSSWYYLRFLDPDNERAAFDVGKVHKFMPVDVYIGGIEHAALHLYFARFMNHFLYSLGLVPQREPFHKMLCHGVIRGKTYQLSNGEYVKSEMVEVKDNVHYHKDTKAVVTVGWEKMSKSKHNGVDPREFIERYSVDTTRLLILSDVSPRSHRNWDDTVLKGTLQLQNKLWSTLAKFIKVRSESLDKPEETEEFTKFDYFIYDSANHFTRQITNSFTETFNIAIAIARLHGLHNSLRKCGNDVAAFSKNYEIALASLIIMFVPITPCFASELWAGFLKAPKRLCDTGEIIWDKPVFQQPWPKVDPNFKPRDEKVMDMIKITEYKGKNAKKKKKVTKAQAA